MRMNEAPETQLPSTRDILVNDKRVQAIDGFIERMNLTPNIANAIRELALVDHSLAAKTRLEQARYFLNREIRHRLRSEESK